MSTIYKYLVSVIEPGDYWFIYQEGDVYVNCEPSWKANQIRILTNLKFNNLINLKINKLTYRCQCEDKCKNICKPPRFVGDYKIYDRFNNLSIVHVDDYYKLSSLARFDHSNLHDLSILKSKYEVLFWVKWRTNKIKFVDLEYVDGLPVYDYETAEKILSVCNNIPKVIFVSNNKVTDTIEKLILIADKLEIKNKIIKIYI